MWEVVKGVIDEPAKKQIGPENVDAKCAETFNAYFTSIGPELADRIPTIENNVNSPVISSTFSLEQVDEHTVISTISGMPCYKATGHDGITVKTLKENIDVLAPVITKILNNSISRGTYPDILKIARVSPIYKSGDINDPGSYRPISVLSIINTVFEKVIAAQLKDYLNVNKLLTDSQHGFRANRSTSSAVLELTQSINTSMHKNEIAVGIFLDLKKAFDTVIHSVLLKKLQIYGFRETTMNLFTSYFSGRKQYVRVGSFSSQYCYRGSARVSFGAHTLLTIC